MDLLQARAAQPGQLAVRSWWGMSMAGRDEEDLEVRVEVHELVDQDPDPPPDLAPRLEGAHHQ